MSAVRREKTVEQIRADQNKHAMRQFENILDGLLATCQEEDAMRFRQTANPDKYFSKSLVCCLFGGNRNSTNLGLFVKLHLVTSDMLQRVVDLCIRMSKDKEKRDKESGFPNSMSHKVSSKIAQEAFTEVQKQIRAEAKAAAAAGAAVEEVGKHGQDKESLDCISQRDHGVNVINHPHDKERDNGIISSWQPDRGVATQPFDGSSATATAPHSVPSTVPPADDGALSSMLRQEILRQEIFLLKQEKERELKEMEEKLREEFDKKEEERVGEKELLRNQNQMLIEQKECLREKNRKLAAKVELLQTKNKKLKRAICDTSSSSLAHQQFSTADMGVSPQQQDSDQAVKLGDAQYPATTATAKLEQDSDQDEAVKEGVAAQNSELTPIMIKSEPLFD